jgi:beta-aspartyl-peptidase (threonine type)
VSEPVVVVHGGAGRIAPENMQEAQAGCVRAAEAGRDALRAGNDALAAAIAAVRVLEDDPAFNAGRGSCFDEAGNVVVDAGVMRGDDLACGAVAALPECGDAILVAHAVLEHSPHVLLAGEGARAFAEAHGVGMFGRDAVWTAKAQARWEAWRAGRTPNHGQADTVGAVVLDGQGRLAAACSTGGVLGKAFGRVGDSPIPGAGYYAAGSLGASCATGSGDAIMRKVACHEVLRRVAAGEDPERAALAVCCEVEALGGRRTGLVTCGLILVDPSGRIGIAHRSTHMSHAYVRGDAAVVAALARPAPPRI